MKKIKLLSLFGLSALFLLSALSLSACVSPEDAENTSEVAAEEDIQAESLPDSVLYYGEVLELRNNDDGSIAQIAMSSSKDGELTINAGPETVWIDSGSMKADDPSTLSTGDRIYVFHSPVTTMSLPPQSAAFAIVRNIPMDVRCAMYHEIEAVETGDKGIIISSEKGSVKITADSETVISAYDGSEVSLEDIKEGRNMMVSYRETENMSQDNLQAFRIMLLPKA